MAGIAPPSRETAVSPLPGAGFSGIICLPRSEVPGSGRCVRPALTRRVVAFVVYLAGRTRPAMRGIMAAPDRAGNPHFFETAQGLALTNVSSC